MPSDRILVVDDSPTTSGLIKLYLAHLGYEVSGVAESAAEALTLVEQLSPQLVLMDINLGEGMDGIEAADVIMNRYRTPVIYVTSYSDEQTLNRAKESMPFGFINKPFRDNDLRVNIEIALARFLNEPYRHDDNPEQTGVREADGIDAEYRLLSEALDHLASGVVMIDDELQVFYKNRSAEKLLGKNAAIGLKNNQLTCVNARTRNDLKNYIEKKTSVIFSLKDNDVPLHLLIFPLNTRPSSAGISSRGSVLFLFETNHDSSRIEDVIRAMYKLSPTEARIAAKLVFNPYLAEISSSLGITYNTARTHLKRIYQKTGTNKLPSLIQTIVTGPAGLLIHSAD